MSPAERMGEARGMAVLAVELQSRGIATASGEMLWGAVNHIINAIVDHHDLAGNTGNPLSRRRAVEYLQTFLQQAHERCPTCSRDDGHIRSRGVPAEPPGDAGHPVGPGHISFAVRNSVSRDLASILPLTLIRDFRKSPAQDDRSPALRNPPEKRCSGPGAFQNPLVGQ